MHNRNTTYNANIAYNLLIPYITYLFIIVHRALR